MSRLICYVFTALLLLSGPLQADPAARLSAHLQAIESLQGRFTQDLLDGRGQRLQASEGQFKLQQPAQIYWETEQPYPELLVSNGRDLWLYDPDLLQATHQRVEAQLEHTPVSLLLNPEQSLATAYHVQLREEAGREIYRLRPRDAQGLLEEVRLTFFQGQLVGLGLEDSLGQITSISLREVERNQEIDPQVFEWTPPAGVDVIREG
ncbi:outer membrane lipoprotein chaperone LolA [Marinospirillum sp.]|uniref:outer membrane lipoprotein chaperone LolA n=1 Tax=Marinospirillum sp. TaxID=2183934 RepID=UPI003A84AA7F